MRAISSFRLEAGISTFWCRARIALRIRASLAATGSVNFIRFASPSHNRLVKLTVLIRHASSVFRRALFPFQLGLFGRRPTTDDDSLPGRLQNSRNFSTQCQPAETQAADSEL